MASPTLDSRRSVNRLFNKLNEKLGGALAIVVVVAYFPVLVVFFSLAVFLNGLHGMFFGDLRDDWSPFALALWNIAWATEVLVSAATAIIWTVMVVGALLGHPIINLR